MNAALAPAVRLIGLTVRLPLIAVLTLIEPLVRAVLSLAIVLGITTAVLFEISAVGPRFPFLELLAVSLGCGAALCAYYGLLFRISR